MGTARGPALRWRCHPIVWRRTDTSRSMMADSLYITALKAILPRWRYLTARGADVTIKGDDGDTKLI
jgi:hypothetical protein